MDTEFVSECGGGRGEASEWFLGGGLLGDAVWDS